MVYEPEIEAAVRRGFALCRSSVNQPISISKRFMDSHPQRKPGQVVEYFLYTAIILETGLAAFFYKLAFQDSGLAWLKGCFAVFYFAFLGWAIGQLHKLHRKRKALEVELQPDEEAQEFVAPEPILREPAPSPVLREAARPFLGLTVAQIAIVVIVFGTAVATFSWAFTMLQSGR